MNSRLQSTPSPVLSESEFHQLREFYYRETGNWFEDAKRYYVDKRVLQRMAITGLDFADYFYRLRFQPENGEMQHLINALTVNETYFFREEYQFKCLVNSLLEEIAAAKAPGERIRIWSVPCSTGEEPFSIAIYLLEYWPGIERYDVELVASDLDTDVLNRAREGIYDRRAVQGLPAPLLRKYFKPVAASSYQIDETLRHVVHFRHANLLQADVGRSERFDVVFCRNLLIYFDLESRRLAAQRLADSLKPGGFLCLGHSESMSRITVGFQQRRFADAIVYQKPFLAHKTD